MLTKEALDAIAKSVIENAPGYHFLVLLAPVENQTSMAIVSSLPKDLQPKMAQAFAEGCANLKNGDAREIPLTKSH